MSDIRTPEECLENPSPRLATNPRPWPWMFARLTDLQVDIREAIARCTNPQHLAALAKTLEELEEQCIDVIDDIEARLRIIEETLDAGR